VIPADAEPAVVPAHARDAAIPAAGTGAERPVIVVEMASRLPEVDELENQTLQECDYGNSSLGELICRGALELLVGFDTVSEPDSVRAILGIAVVGRNFLFGDLVVLVAREEILADLPALLKGKTLSDYEEAGEAALPLWNHEIFYLKLDTEELLIEGDPGFHLLLDGQWGHKGSTKHILKCFLVLDPSLSD